MKLTLACCFGLAMFFLFSLPNFDFFLLIFILNPTAKTIMGILGVRLSEKTCEKNSQIIADYFAILIGNDMI